MKRVVLIGVVACCVCAGDATAKPCPAKLVRARAARVLVETEAAFAIPVATVVVSVQPTVLYSYRAAALTQAFPNASSRVDVDASVDRLPRTAEVILRERCMACHRGDTPEGGLAFFEKDGALFKALPRRAMLEMASPNAQGVTPMPPGEATKLSAEELEILRQWAEPPRDIRY